MSSTINILPLPNLETPDVCRLHPNIPQGSCLIVAPSNSGKTTLIVNLLLRQVFGVLVHYKHIYIFSPTCRSDASWDMVQPEHYHPFRMKCPDGKRRLTAEIHLHDTFDQARIARIMKDQEEVPRPERDNVLLIIDDFASEFKDTVTMSRLVMRGRHSKVWVWISTQLYRKIPRSIRVNMPYYIFFLVNTNELKTISEELATGSISAFEALFRRCTEAAFSFFCINAKLPVAQRYFCNFKKIES